MYRYAKSDLVLRDLDLIKTFPDARVGFSINTLDETFKDDMDKAVSIVRRLSAMKRVHDAGIRTTCFISPIFPGITDVPAIIDRVKNQCNLVWLENLNPRGSYKSVIMGYIKEKHPDLISLYDEIYLHGSRLYWEALDCSIRSYAEENGLEYMLSQKWISGNNKISYQYLNRGVVSKAIHIPRRTRRGA